MAKITKQQVQKIADLARIKLTDKELGKFATEISDILDYVGQLQEVDVDDVERASHVADFQGQILQPDQPQKGLTNQQVFLNGEKRSGNGYFKVNQIVVKD